MVLPTQLVIGWLLLHYTASGRLDTIKFLSPIPTLTPHLCCEWWTEFDELPFSLRIYNKTLFRFCHCSFVFFRVAANAKYFKFMFQLVPLMIITPVFFLFISVRLKSLAAGLWDVQQNTFAWQICSRSILFTQSVSDEHCLFINSIVWYQRQLHSLCSVSEQCIT